jgi:hypothetical protein
MFSGSLGALIQSKCFLVFCELREKQQCFALFYGIWRCSWLQYTTAVVWRYVNYFCLIFGRLSKFKFIYHFFDSSYLYENDVLDALKTFDSNKGVGPNWIPSIFLKNCAVELAWPLTLLLIFYIIYIYQHGLSRNGFKNELLNNF